jgi:hypothetical protein
MKKTLRDRTPLAPYYPALAILAGAMAVVIGGFWAAMRQRPADAGRHRPQLQRQPQHDFTAYPTTNTRRGRMLAPYYPALVILAGAIVVAIGGFWAAARQANFNARLNDKNTEIIALQGQQINAVTGGDSYPYVMPSFVGDGKVTMLLMNQGKYPLYDVQVTIVDGDLSAALIKNSDDVSRDINTIQSQSQQIYKIGNLGEHHSSWLPKYDLDPKTGARNFTMYLLARNGQVNEWMSLRFVKNHWSVAVIALNEKGVLERHIGDDFPNNEREFFEKQYPANH